MQTRGCKVGCAKEGVQRRGCKGRGAKDVTAWGACAKGILWVVPTSSEWCSGRQEGEERVQKKRCRPPSQERLTCNYTQQRRKQRVCFFKKARRAGFFSGPIAFFLRIFDEFFSGFRAKFQKIVTCVAFSIKFAKTNQKFAENSEFCENYSLFFKIIHFTP